MAVLDRLGLLVELSSNKIIDEGPSRGHGTLMRPAGPYFSPKVMMLLSSACVLLFSCNSGTENQQRLSCQPTCPVGWTCSAGQCLRLCHDELDCNLGEGCVQGICRAGSSSGTQNLGPALDGNVCTPLKGCERNGRWINNACVGESTCGACQICTVDGCQDKEPSGTENACKDNKDNDCDGATDDEDEDCEPDPIDKPQCSDEEKNEPESLCGDLIDNDCDERPDCYDPDCSTDPACIPEDCAAQECWEYDLDGETCRVIPLTRGVECQQGAGLCDNGQCLLLQGQACDENPQGCLGYCRTDVDGLGQFCVDSETQCVQDGGGDKNDGQDLSFIEAEESICSNRHADDRKTGTCVEGEWVLSCFSRRCRSQCTTDASTAFFGCQDGKATPRERGCDDSCIVSVTDTGPAQTCAGDCDSDLGCVDAGTCSCVSICFEGGCVDSVLENECSGTRSPVCEGGGSDGCQCVDIQ